MRRIIYGTILLILLIEMAFASGYGNVSPGRIIGITPVDDLSPAISLAGNGVGPIDNVSPASGLVGKSTHIVEIVDVVASDKDEYLVLLNKGKEYSVLERWFLSVGEKILLSLPRIDLAPDSEVELHIGNGNNSTATKIYIGYSSPILDDAGNVSLLDESGRIVVEKRYP